jgi:glycosyltransferase involved in cell wall biosynthesis
MSTVVVHHFGPDPATVGGMATVIRVLTEGSVGGDLVDSHPTWQPRASAAMNARLMAQCVGVLARTPAGHVAHIHLSERGSFLREGALVALARRRNLVTVATIHGASFIPFASTYPWLVSAVLQRAHAVTCLDEKSLHVVQLRAPKVRAELVPNPGFVDDRPSPADGTEALVVFAGEISLRKGADILHSAWRLVAQRLPDARCLMIGPVVDFQPSSLERLEVLPAVGPIELREILRRARVVALPSRAEVVPMVLVEAMSLGRPFVSTPVGGIPELASEGGILVDVDDDVELADRLTDLLTDADMARAMGERGRRFCMRTRSIEVIDARLRELYAVASAR